MSAVGADVFTRELSQLRGLWVHASVDDVMARAQGWVAHPCAGHRVDAAEVWWDTGTRLRDAARFDAAVSAFERAIAAGYRSWPLPEADIAECWLRAGRTDDAARLYAELRQREPGDVWLYDAAGFAYATIGDHRAALKWFTAGLELALATGDPERLVAQLDEARTISRGVLGLGPDEVTDRAAAFRTQRWVRPTSWLPRAYQGLAPPPVTACAHCGWPTPPSTSGPVRTGRAGERVLRNEPCWCGSGRKYKRCCALDSPSDRSEADR